MTTLEVLSYIATWLLGAVWGIGVALVFVLVLLRRRRERANPIASI